MNLPAESMINLNIAAASTVHKHQEEVVACGCFVVSVALAQSPSKYSLEYCCGVSRRTGPRVPTCMTG